MFKFDPPHITGKNTQEQLEQVIRYLRTMAEMLNMVLEKKEE